MSFFLFLLSIFSFVWYSLWTCVFVVLGSTVLHFIFAENHKYEQKKKEAKHRDSPGEYHSSMMVVNRGRTISTDTHELMFPCLDYRRDSLPQLIACSTSTTSCSKRRRKGRSSMTKRATSSSSHEEHSSSRNAVPRGAATGSIPAPSTLNSSTLSSSSVSSSFSRKCAAQHKTLSTRRLKASLQETLSLRGRRSS